MENEEVIEPKDYFEDLKKSLKESEIKQLELNREFLAKEIEKAHKLGQKNLTHKVIDMKKANKPKEGYTSINVFDCNWETFTDMSYFEKHVPKGCKLLHVNIEAEDGYYDEPPSFFFHIHWIETPVDTSD